MGWFEVLALLKRLMPLLARVTPMLETFIASRIGVHAGNDAEFQRVAGDIRAQLTATADQHGSVAELLAVQGAQIASVAKNVDSLRGGTDRFAARLLEIEITTAALTRSIRWVMALLVSLLAVCLGLGLLLFQHMR